MILFVLASGMVYFIRGGSISTSGVKKWNKDNLIQAKEEEKDLSGIDKITMELKDADVEIRFIEESKIHVAEFTSDKQQQNVFELSQSGSQITIKRNQEDGINLFGENKYHLVQVEIPKSYMELLKVGTTSGDIDILDDVCLSDLTLAASSGGVTCEKKIIADTIEVSTSSGKQKFEDIESVNYEFNTTSGTMKINELKGDGELAGTSGSIEVGELLGSNHEIYTSSGNIDIQKGQGSFEIDCTSGKIKMSQLEGEGEIQTTSGDMYVKNIVLTGNLEIQSTSGKVELAFEDEVDAKVNVETLSGDIDGNIDFDYTDKRERNATVILGGGKENKVMIETTSGNIEIKQG